MFQGFFLGLSTGAACLAYCSPILVPYLLGEAKPARQTAVTLARFHLGRLLGYCLFAVFAWASGNAVEQDVVKNPETTGVLYIALATLLIVYGWLNPSSICSAKPLQHRMRGLFNRCPAIIPLLLGLFTSLNLCPPLLLAFVVATQKTGLGACLLFFLSFFLGTALYFLPLPLLGALGYREKLKTIGKMASIVTAMFYLYSGILLMIGGLS